MSRRRPVAGKGAWLLALVALASSCVYPELSTSNTWNSASGGATGNGGGTAGVSTAGTLGGSVRGGEPGVPEGGSTSSPSSGSGGSSTAGTAALGEGGSDSSEPMGGSGGDVTVGGGGSGGQPPTGPYAPRSGTFKMLAYTKVIGFVHSSISAGLTMLSQISAEQGFALDVTENNESFTAAGLAEYELVFFLNTTGDILGDNEQQAFESWMMEEDGAFAGAHAAANTEPGWPFYLGLVGQIFDDHTLAGVAEELSFESSLANHPALSGLPNPWPLSDEWLNFNGWQTWSAEGGFTILLKRESNGHPVSFVRERSNYRSFYTSLGHSPAMFQDANVKKHLTGAIMWAVRREHCLKSPRPAGCPQ